MNLNKQFRLCKWRASPRRRAASEFSRGFQPTGRLENIPTSRERRLNSIVADATREKMHAHRGLKPTAKFRRRPAAKMRQHRSKQLALAATVAMALSFANACAEAPGKSPDVYIGSRPTTLAAGEPEPPRVYLDTTYTPPKGRSIEVKAGGDLQAALNHAKPGDAITLEAGASFTGNFTLPRKSGSGQSEWIVVRSSTADSNLPPPGTRITPSYSNVLPKIVSPNSEPAIKASSGAHHYRFIGLEIGHKAG